MTERAPLTRARAGRILWLRLVALTVFGGVATLIAMAIVGSFGDTSAGAVSVYIPAYATGIGVPVGVGCLAYLLVRASGDSRSRALLAAAGIVPATFGVAVLIVWLLVSAVS